MAEQGVAQDIGVLAWIKKARQKFDYLICLLITWFKKDLLHKITL